MMMMGGMGGSGGSMGSGSSMGMMDMDMMGMGSSGMGNMAGMSGSGTMAGMPMQGMPMQGMPNGYMQGMANGSMNHGAMQGMYDPSAMAGMNNGTGSLLGTGGFNLNSLLGGILNLAIDIFAILLVVGLVVGAAVLIKRYLFEGDLFAPKAKVACVNCGQVLNADWACCPKCGQAKVVPQPVAANPQTV